MAWMWLGVRPIMRLASTPTASGRPSFTLMATTDGSLSTIPRPRTYTRVLAVPRSTAMSRPMMLAKTLSDMRTCLRDVVEGGKARVRAPLGSDKCGRADGPRVQVAVIAALHHSMARSPRMVPGAASAGLVAPIIVRTTFQVSPGPSTTASSAGERVMNDTRSSKKGLPSCSP
jgi:hypothetical protein